MCESVRADVLINTSAHQMVSCLCFTDKCFSCAYAGGFHFLFNSGEQEIVCHLPIICDSSCECEKSFWSSPPGATTTQTPAALYRLFAAHTHPPPPPDNLVVSEGQGDRGGRWGGGGRYCSTHLSVFAPAGSDLVWEDRGDRQHAEPRFRQEVHPGLLL